MQAGNIMFFSFQEGLNNEKFDSHPSSPEELPAYLRVHNPWYHGLDLLASLVLILLAFTEDPAVPTFEVKILILRCLRQSLSFQRFIYIIYPN